MEKQPILSICIPTFKREYIIDKLIEGILVQNCDESLYEICITDNSETDETKELIERKYASIRNLHYKKLNKDAEYKEFKENNKTGYLVDDTVYFENIIPKKKGGYNLIDNFVRIYLTMVNEDLLKPKIISASTYRRIEFHILRFCAANYVNTKTINGYSFTFDDSKGLITNQCGWKGYLVYRLFIPIYILRHYISRKK